MSIEYVENFSLSEPLSDRLTETLRWTAVSIAKIIAVAVVVIGILASFLPHEPAPPVFATRIFAFTAEAISIVQCLGFCRGIKEIFFYSPPHILENHLKNTKSIVPVCTDS